MKKFICVTCVVLTAFSLTACNTSKKEITPSEPTNETISKTPSEPQSSVPNEIRDEFVTLSARPVDVAADMLILQDTTNLQYGLYSTSGKEVLPCEYSDMKFIIINNYEPKVYVAAQSKGFYGVYDLNGTEIVAPMYDDITEGAEYADCIIVEKSGMFGVVDLNGNEIIPLKYADISCSPQRVLGAALKDGTTCTIDLYAPNGALQNSFQTELIKIGSFSGGKGDGETSLDFYSWGNTISIRSDDTRNIYEQNCTADGTVLSSMLNGQLSIDYPYFENIENSTLSFINGKTGETVASIDLQLNEGEFVYLQGSLKTDVSSGNVSGVISVTIYNESLLPVDDAKYYLVSLGDSSSICPIEAYNGVGPFYNDSAFAMTNDKLYILDISGNTTELSVPFKTESGTVSDNCLLEDCAVLVNNGYVYVINKEGETILSEDGYTSVSWTSHTSSWGEGLIELTASDGSVQIIDSYGNDIIPLGNNFEQVSLYDASGEEIEAYSLFYDQTVSQYIFTDNLKWHSLETNDKIDDTFVQQLFNGNGWVIWDEIEEKLFAVISEGSGYQICDVAGTAE